MTITRHHVVIAVLAIAAAALIGQAVAQPAAPAGIPAGSKVGTCDIVEIFNNYQKAKDLTAQFNQKRDTIKAENDKRTKAIDTIQAELDALKTGSKEYEDRLSVMQQLGIDRKAWLEFQEELAMREHHRLTREMYEEIVAMIGDLAKKQNLEVVLFRERGSVKSADTADLLRQMERRKVLYANDNLDLTEQVLTKLNESYRKPK